MNYQQNMNLHEQITKAIFENGLLNQQILQREGIIVKLQAEISENTNKLQEKINTAAETRERLNTTIKEAYERISELEDDMNGMNRQQEVQAEHYNTQLETAKGELATQRRCSCVERALKNETIRGLHTRLDLMKKNEAKLTEKSDKIIEILQGTLADKQKQIQENEEAFKILNATIASHATEIDRIKNDYDRKIQEMEVDFKKSLEEQSAECLKQVKKTNTRADEFRDSYNQSTRNLTTIVENIKTE